MGRYKILSRNKGNSIKFDLYEEGKLLCSFTRDTVRTELEALGRSSHWEGCIIRMLNKQYPLPVIISHNGPSSIEYYTLNRLIDYLKSKGYLVFEPLPIPDKVMIDHLIDKGYIVALPRSERNKVIESAVESTIVLKEEREGYLIANDVH